MNVYLSMFALICALLIIHRRSGFSKNAKRLFYFFVAMILLLVAGFRYRVGTDYTNYQRNYYSYKTRDVNLFSQPALSIVAHIAAFLFDDFATWFFLMSVITITPVMKGISDNSISVELSVIMYLLLGCWHFSFNLVKQCAAASILFVAYPALRDKKLVKWCIACLIASMFHISALLMIPVYFLVSPTITTKRTVLIICVGIITLLSYDYLFDLIDFLKQGESVVSRKWDVSTDSVNILRILVHCVPIVLCGLLYKEYNAKDKDFSCLFNISLLNAMLNIGSMNSIYLNRFCCYTNIFNVLFIPVLLKPLRKRRYWWVTPIALVLYFAFWVYDLYKGSSTVDFYWIFNR